MMFMKKDYRNSARKSLQRARKIFGKPTSKLVKSILRSNKIYGEFHRHD